MNAVVTLDKVGLPFSWNFWRQFIGRLRSKLKFSARFHIAVGLSSLLGSVVLLAIFMDLVPDRKALQLESRVRLSESIATMGSVLLREGDTSGLRYSLEFLVRQNVGMQAISIKRDSGGEFHFRADDTGTDQSLTARHRTDDIHVPLLQRDRQWGELIVQFKSAQEAGLVEQYKKSRWALVFFISLLSFPLFYLFLGKVLKELNPSTAVPSRVRSALDTIAEALLVLDSNANLVLANAAFVDLAGQPVEDMLGRSAKTLSWCPEENDSAYVWEDALFNSVSTRHQKMGFVDSNGSKRMFQVNCSPVLTANDETGGVLISMDDITQLEEQEMLLRQSMEDAEKANSAKSLFLSNMSHEIRTPMNAILGFTEIMKRSNRQTDSERLSYLNTISRSGQHLLELINDVLDLSKVESGALEVELLPSNCAEIANDVINVLHAKAEEKSIGLTLDILTPLPLQIVTDPSRLRQVITNLVGNAIKFTDEGNVAVQIALEAGSDNTQTMLAIDIQDSGIGMSEEQQGRIFEAFSQADASISRRFGGTGLGLSISKQLTEAMDGELSVSSEEGKGSTFHVRLPVGEVEVELVEPEKIYSMLNTLEEEQQTVWEIEPSRILVVDDGAENRQLLSIVLRDLNLDVVLAENGKQGVDTLFEHVATAPFDLVFMDIQMPVMDGYTAVAEMRSRGASLPVVALTANAMKGFEKKVLDAGFSHYMAKPIDLDKMSALLADLLGGQRKQLDKNSMQGALEQLPQHRVTRGDNTEGDITGNGNTHGDCEQNQSVISSVAATGKKPEFLTSKLAEKDERFIPIVEEFIVRLAERLIELQTALDAADWKQLDDIGHWLKGSAANVGIERLVTVAVDLQLAAQTEDVDSCALHVATIEQLQQLVVADPRDMEADVESQAMESETNPSENSKETEIDCEPVFSALPVSQEAFYEVVDSFIDRMNSQLTVLREAVDHGEYAKVAELAHWLRGSGGNVGYTDFVELCNALEFKANAEADSLDDELHAIEALARRVTQGWEQTARPEGMGDG